MKLQAVFAQEKSDFMAQNKSFATRAFIFLKNKVLIIRESKKYKAGNNIGLFDVPGGKVEGNESFEDCLKREVKEETNLEIEIIRPFFADRWFPVVDGKKLEIEGTYFICKPNSKLVEFGEDHDKFEWIAPKEHKKYKLIKSVHLAFEAYLKLEKIIKKS